MSGTPDEQIATTVGTMMHNYNEISDHVILENGNIEEGHTLYPQTKEQLKIIKENLPDDSDDEKTRAEKSEKVKEQKSTIFDRISARFSEEYLEHTVALLGYNIGTNKLSKVMDKFEIKQILNHIFKANIVKNAKLFSMEKFRHRPIFCGVNVMYDPTASEEFNTMQHTDEYLNGTWKNEYNNADYMADANGEYRHRDITFSPTFLGDLQSAAGTPGKSDVNELVSVFIRNGFSVGLCSVDNTKLEPTAALPPQYSRVFTNKYEFEPMYDYSTILLPAKTPRLNPTASDTAASYVNIPNSEILLEIPPLVSDDGKDETQPSEVKPLMTDHPCIIFAGETLEAINPKEGEAKGYALATFTAVPICSWKHFSESSEYRGTKAVERLSATNICGPFTRVIAKGFYSSAISNILQTYTEINLIKGKYTDDEGNEHETFGFREPDGTFNWNTVSGELRAAVMLMYNELGKDNVIIKDNSGGVINDMELYEKAYYRYAENYSSYPFYIKKLFNSTILPLRFAFFRTESSSDAVHIRQYPAMPILGALPMQDDYITQLVPVYRSLDETPSEDKGINWYINPRDILVDGKAGTFYNVSVQPYEKATYPNMEGQGGIMFTYTGHLYKGAEEGTNLPKHVEAIRMGSILEGKETQSEPMLIAANNYLKYMYDPGSWDEAELSRSAYKEFIKQGCVWQHEDKLSPIPDTVPLGINDFDKYNVDKSDKVIDEKEPINKDRLIIASVVVGVVVLIVIGFIVYRAIKKKMAKDAGMDPQGFLCGESI